MKYQIFNLENKFSDSVKVDGTATYQELNLISCEKKINIIKSSKTFHFIIHFDGRIEILNNGFDLPILLTDFTKIFKIINDITLNTFGKKAHLKFN